MAQRNITVIPKVPEGAPALQSQPTMFKRFVDTPDQWKEIREWTQGRAKDLQKFDGWDRKDATARAWVEASYKWHPPPTAKHVKWPDVQKEKEKLEAAKDKIKARVKQLDAESTLPEPTQELMTPWEAVKIEGGDVSNITIPLSDDEHDGETLVAHIMWVYSQIDVQVDKRRAPSTGAWSLLQWARDNRDVFYRTLVLNAISAKEKLEKLRLDAHLKEKQLEADLRKREQDAHRMSEDEAMELAATLDVLKEFGLDYSVVSEGILAPLKEPPTSDLKKAVGWTDTPLP